MATSTLTRYLLAANRAGGPELGHASVLSAVAVAMKMVAALVSRGPLILGKSATAQPTAADVKRALRKQAIEALLSQLDGVQEVAALSLAGKSTIIQCSPTGRYLLLVDPMHGMSNLDDNLSVGSTFSVLEVDPRPGPWTAQDFLQAGVRQVGAGLALFGPRTLFVLTAGHGVDGFTLDRDVGNFVLTHPHVTIPSDAHVFAINASEAGLWPAPVRRYVDECVQGEAGPRGVHFTMRWNASAVVGVFRVLNSGGIFMVPQIDRESAWLAPLLYTAAPLAFLAEQAGGRATTGSRRILDVVPTALATRVPLFLGDADEVGRLEGYVAEHDRGDDLTVDYPLFHHRSLFVD